MVPLPIVRLSGRDAAGSKGGDSEEVTTRTSLEQGVA
jgi:hypothetical protein